MNIGVLYNSPHFTTSATTSSKHNHVKEFPNRSFSFLFMIYMNIIEREGGGRGKDLHVQISYSLTT